MDPLFPGLYIRQERLKRNWSQEGLCKGVCSVSYLSRLERGEAEASAEIVRLSCMILASGRWAHEESALDKKL